MSHDQTSNQSTPFSPGRKVVRHGLTVDADLASFIDEEALAGSDLDRDAVWLGFSELVHDLEPENRRLLARRAELQTLIDEWHQANGPGDPLRYREFLEAIGYISPTGPAFEVNTTGLDREIALVPGPQLVVPATNARYVLNAANARWGSLYDALYGTDALGWPPAAKAYDPVRGAKVILWSKQFLDLAIPLNSGSHVDGVGYRIVDGSLVVDLAGGATVGIAPNATLVGWTGPTESPRTILVEHHGLGAQLVIDASHPVGRHDPAHVCDVQLEAAVTTIVDLEDSVATVDGVDKTLAYRNWLGLLRGTLTAEIGDDGNSFVRSLADDLTVTGPDGSTVSRPGRSLLLVRNVGHLMTTPAVLNRDGAPIPEGLLDAFVSVLCAREDALGRPAVRRNSQTGSIYVVKPKMHGPDEVRFTDAVFGRVEALLGLPPLTVKIGIMDEERRTTVNLAECLRVVRSRVAFINTGFLDRTGDEIHTSMHAGPMVRKSDMKMQRWITAYEDWNVDTALTCGLSGRAQIGKGMWAAPDQMAEMMREKISHVRAGASCAWVPSPTAATLHATHYHQVDVRVRQAELHQSLKADGPRATMRDLLTIPVADPQEWTASEIQVELDNNVQGILGYVVRWVDQGVGCSKVPDLNDIDLMEDRATCRISSQHIANWLHHGVVSIEQVDESFRRIAAVVDRQNASDPSYRRMTPRFEGQAYRAARSLAVLGITQPSGYTEPILHAHRLERKRELAP